MATSLRAPGRAGCRAAAPAPTGRPRAAPAVRAAAISDRLCDVAGRRQTLLAGGAVLGGLLLPGGAGGVAAAEAASPPANDSIYDLSALMYGEEVPLDRYRGKVGAPPGRCRAGSSSWEEQLAAPWETPGRRPCVEAALRRGRPATLAAALTTDPLHHAFFRCCWWSTWRANDPCRCVRSVQARAPRMCMCRQRCLLQRQQLAPVHRHFVTALPFPPACRT